MGSNVGDGARVLVGRSIGEGVEDGKMEPFAHAVRIHRATHETSPRTMFVFISMNLSLSAICHCPSERDSEHASLALPVALFSHDMR